MANRYWVGGTESWDATAGTKWALTSGGAGGEAVPTTSDDVFFDANSTGTVTLAAAGSAHHLNFTNFGGTWANSAFGLTIAGSLTLKNSTMIGAGQTGTWTFTATDAQTVDFKAVSTNLTLVFNGAGGTWTFQNLIVCNAGNRSITLSQGTLDFNGHSITYGSFISSGTGVRTLKLGTGTFELQLNVTWWNCGTSTNMTLVPSTSTIRHDTTYGTTLTFAGGGLTYNNILILGGNTYNFSGDNTFNNFQITTPPHTVQFTAGSTTTVTSFSVSGTAGNLNTLKSITNGSAWNLVKAGGFISVDYVSLQDCAAATSIKTFNGVELSGFHAGANSTNVSGNTGWIFTAPSVTNINGLAIASIKNVNGIG